MRTGGCSEIKDPLSHFFGGLVGKGYRADIVRPDSGLYKRSNAICNDAGFSASRPCQYQ
jgi:hypothetical protein